ncbi:MAG: hypothetical protein U1E43_01260 [Rhodospirillales bacterium]
MTDNEVKADLARDTVWQRPSWPLGAAGISLAGTPPGWLEFGLFEEHRKASRRERRRLRRRRCWSWNCKRR